jgi:serine/threonine protein phosphatase PrpC
MIQRWPFLTESENGELTAENLTYPHKASDSAEKKRIEELGGHVFFGRVFGALAVARAFGDSRYKQPKTSQNFVSVEPFLLEVELNPSYKYVSILPLVTLRYLILACDGLWDVCTHEEASKFVHKLFTEGKTEDEVARRLVQYALDLKTDDNVTVVVVKIDWAPVQKTVQTLY